MSTSKFQAGAVVSIDKKPYVLVRLVDGNEWQLEDVRTRRASHRTAEQLSKLYVEGKLRFLTEALGDEAASLPAQPVVHSAEEWEKAKVKRAYVKAVLELPSNRKTLIGPINEVWKKVGQSAQPPHVSTVIRWKRKFILANGNIKSLIDRNDRKGNTKIRNQDLQPFVDQAIAEVFMQRERGTVQDTVNRAAALVGRENAQRLTSMQLPLPTRRLIERNVSAILAYDRCAARYGRTAADVRFRGMLGHRTTDEPLERAEIDHTRLDLMAVDENMVPLGRPWVTVCIDDHTRCILGIYIGFQPPSHLTVARCLKHAFLPKVKLRDEFPEIVNAWEPHGVMRTLACDNGIEFHGTGLEKACLTLNIEMHFAPRKTGWFKGKVERWQGSLNRDVVHVMPGTTFANIFDKDDYDPSKHAVMRYSMIRQLIHKWIADVYHQKVHSALHATPAAMWARSVDPNQIPIPDNPAELDAVLGRPEARVLTHKGIEFSGLLYNSPELIALRRRLGEKLEVELSVDPEDLGKIFVYSPDKREVFTAQALQRDYATGLSEWQHRIFKKYAALQSLTADPTGWLEAKLRISELVENEGSRRHKSRARVARFKGDKALAQEAASKEISAKVNSSDRGASDAPLTIDHEPTPPSGLPALSSEVMAPRKIFEPEITLRVRQMDDEPSTESSDA